jgi:hypothetical protein
MDTKTHCINCSGIFEGNGASCCSPNCMREYIDKQSSKKIKQKLKRQSLKINAYLPSPYYSEL